VFWFVSGDDLSLAVPNKDLGVRVCVKTTITKSSPEGRQNFKGVAKLAEQLAFWRCNLLIALRRVRPNKTRLLLFDRLLSNTDS
jgi:hypothetical protein